MTGDHNSVEGLRKAARRVFWEAKNMEKAKEDIRKSVMLEVADWLDRSSDIGGTPLWYEGDNEDALTYEDGYLRGYSSALDEMAAHIRFEYDRENYTRTLKERIRARKSAAEQLTREYGPIVAEMLG